MTGATPASRGELIIGLEAFADIAEFGQDLGGADFPGAREGHDDASVGQVGDGGLDPAGELAKLVDEAGECARESANHLSFGLALDLTGLAERSGAEPLQQGLGRAVAAGAVPGEDADQACAAEPPGAVRRRGAVQEGERDGAGDVGEDERGAGSDAVEERCELRGRVPLGRRPGRRGPATGARKARMASDWG